MKPLDVKQITILKEHQVLCFDPKNTTFNPSALNQNFWAYLNPKKQWPKAWLNLALEHIAPSFESVDDFLELDKLLVKFKRFSSLTMPLYLHLLKQYHKHMPNKQYDRLDYLSHLLNNTKTQTTALYVFHIFPYINQDLKINFAKNIYATFESQSAVTQAKELLDSFGVKIDLPSKYTHSEKKIVYHDTLTIDLSLAKEYVNGNLVAAKNLMALLMQYATSHYPYQSLKADEEEEPKTTLSYQALSTATAFSIQTISKEEYEQFSPWINALIAYMIESNFYQNVMKPIYDNSDYLPGLHLHSREDVEAFKKVVQYHHLDTSLSSPTQKINRKKI